MTINSYSLTIQAKDQSFLTIGESYANESD
ncbi:hypothetical protein COLO4_03273 [Corchorus olitorius]|uniref:Uncharacterized protein n=1 Tax=Corchorus olitorius TaxID=93759 RepID=A0A1R3KZ56_9ROSI|nr:hypothetical protein COLO4_03273 [Corchorus olitorius]